MEICGNTGGDIWVKRQDARYLSRFTKVLLRLSTGPCRDDYLKSLSQYDPHIARRLDHLRHDGWTIRISQPRNFLFWNWELENGRYADPVIILPDRDIVIPLYRQQHLLACLTGLRVLRHFRLKTANNIEAVTASRGLFDVIGTQDTEAISEIVSVFLREMANDLSGNARLSDEWNY
jgi:hypothetical protein